jgi:DNA primase
MMDFGNYSFQKAYKEVTGKKFDAQIGLGDHSFKRVYESHAQAYNGLQVVDLMYEYQYPLTLSGKFYLEITRRIAPRVHQLARVGYDSTSHSVVFPWYVGNDLRLLSARNLVKGAKYRVIGEDTQKRDILYLPFRTLTSDPLILVEGEMDALKVASAGFTNVAALGRGNFSERLKTFLLKAYSGNELVLFLDNDDAGRDLQQRLIKFFAGVYYCRSISYLLDGLSKAALEGCDPGNLVNSEIQSLVLGAKSSGFGASFSLRSA